MSRQVTGWGFVAVQAILIIALVVLPGRNDWPTPTGVTAVGSGVIIAGFVIMGVAALRLGRSLTPTPVPKTSGELQTNGLYQFVRHPIYTGVLATIVGLTIRSGSFITATVAIVAIGFFNAKAQWEEAQLAKTYPGYIDYAKRTPRFVPQPWRKR